ncbi:MAG TPA: DMT family transporter [Mycobacteriales bacterium]|nr:DMT family transporter [Mycobacteriales bacterium]
MSRPAGAAPGALERPPRIDLLLIGLAVAAVSTSAPIIAACHAPKLAIAMWRNAFATGLLAPIALARPTPRREVASLRSRGQQRWAVPAGLLLAAHFGTWIPSVGLTSVASATAMVSTQPAWAALLARRDGVQLPRRAWTGIGVSIAGVIVITGVDVSISARALAGDLLALVGAAFAAAYMSAGGRARQVISTTSYTVVCYALCAALLVLVCLIGGVGLGGYRAHDWWLIAALTAGPQLLGHSVFNRVLRTTSATVVSLSILLEVPGAVLVAWIWLGQTPRALAYPGLVVLIAGIALVVRAGTQPAAQLVDPPD